MTSELRPCPFCGGEASKVKKVGFKVHGIVCTKCPCELVWFGSEQEATNAWNTRAERTCKPKFNNSYFGICDCGYGVYFEKDGKRVWYVPERTCKPIDEYFCGVPSCGNCGVTLNMETSGVRPFNKVLPNYCHNCGARVTNEVG